MKILFYILLLTIQVTKGYCQSNKAAHTSQDDSITDIIGVYYGKEHDESRGHEHSVTLKLNNDSTYEIKEFSAIYDMLFDKEDKGKWFCKKDTICCVTGHLPLLKGDNYKEERLYYMWWYKFLIAKQELIEVTYKKRGCILRKQ